MKEINIVIDNSTLIAFTGLDGAGCLDLVSKYINKNSNIFAPTLLRFEFANYIKKFDSDILYELLDLYSELNITFVDSDLESIVKLSKQFNLTGYDASYLATLNNLNKYTKLITFDQNFAKVKDKRIKLLSFT